MIQVQAERELNDKASSASAEFMRHSPDIRSNTALGNRRGANDEGVQMNQTAAAAQRHIEDLEGRVARQQAVVEALASAGLDSGQAERTLHLLQRALDLTREHIRILLPGGTRRSWPAQPSVERAG